MQLGQGTVSGWQSMLADCLHVVDRRRQRINTSPALDLTALGWPGFASLYQMHVMLTRVAVESGHSRSGFLAARLVWCLMLLGDAAEAGRWVRSPPHERVGAQVGQVV